MSCVKICLPEAASHTGESKCTTHYHTTKRNILVPWDGLVPIEVVRDLAGSIGGPHANLMLLPVASGHSDAHPELPAPSGSGQESAWSRIEVLERSDAGKPALEIVAVAARRQVDLILMTTRCHQDGEIDIACSAAELALDSPTPVMVVHVDGNDVTAFPPHVSRLVVPLDGSPRAAQALPFTVSLARRLRLAVRLVMVIDPARMLPPAYAYDAEASAQMLARLRNEAHNALTEAEHQLVDEGVEVTSELLYGPVNSSIEAAVQPGDVLVMTTHGTGGASQKLGSVAARLLADIPSPLIIMRGSHPVSLVVSGHGERGPFESFSRPTA